jgi:hypothetical protein
MPWRAAAVKPRWLLPVTSYHKASGARSNHGRGLHPNTGLLGSGGRSRCEEHNARDGGEAARHERHIGGR